MTDPTLTSPDIPVAPASRSLWSDAWRNLRKRPSVIIATMIIALFTVVAIAPGLFTSTDPRRCDVSQSRLPPQGFGGLHPLGTNTRGCDLYAQVIHGAQPSLLLALVVVTCSVIIGLILGTLSGYYLGWVDAIVSRVVEVFLVIPLLLGALLLLSLFRNVQLGTGQLASIAQPAIVLTLFGWMTYTRYVRASVLETKSLDYVMAAKVLGASDLRVMARHILPNALGPVTALVPTAVATVIGTEAVLAYLGIGVRPPAVSWGVLINEGSEWFAAGTHYLLLAPLLCLLATVLAFVVLGDALRDALDPKLR
ncbi:ABC transporter permease [Naumannella halotolerans]|uniref:Oligopeptide transport system permease protein n=1 Tax=Naumannella halotolerans TaxID=993414 RepID=A0A4R7J8T8_9ACTN|nr:ABC transporter permease [Naumannella halotolerans]TDT33932.1 oligopeptide transport system permease protein [Naumannella halotolerans]